MTAALSRAGAALTLLLCAVAGAQSSGGPYAIPRQSIDAGAVRADSASYAIEASIGQPDAAPKMQGPIFSLRGGLLAREVPAGVDTVFANGFE